MVKKTRGRKQHIIIDTMGNLPAVAVHAANAKAGIRVAQKAKKKYPAIKRFCVDTGYCKSFEEDVRALRLGVDISERIALGWNVLPKHWVVERTFAWTNNSRRRSKDYEITVASAEAMCMIAALRTMIARF